MRARGFELDLALVPQQTDAEAEANLRASLDQTPQERLQAMLMERG